MGRRLLLAALGALPVLPACSLVGQAPPAANLRLEPRASAAAPAPGLPAASAPGLSAVPTPDLPSNEDALESSGDTGLYFEAFSHPVVHIRADEDPEEYDDGLELEADLRTGDGYGVAAGVTYEGIGFGVLYLTSDHLVRDTAVEASFHGAFLEARAVGRHELGWGQASVGLGLGAGLGGVDFDQLFTDDGGTALEARLTAGLHLRHVGLELEGGAFSWGVPGETVGTGTYVGAGITFRF